ncbi:sensor histidine kinase [Cohnella sp. GCM10020058]|uniref:sensor histidine kinase n=1 Tax=Cohnella sp. GCM10020058 TaxID=3317330 RepID=UPI00362F4DEB
MFSRLANIPWRSIRVKLVLGLLAVTLPLIALLIYNNQYSVGVVHNQVAMSNENLIRIYMKQIDGQLTEAERHMVALQTTDPNVQAMGESASEDAYMLAKSAVSRKLSSDLTVYPYIDGFFVYSVTRRDIVDAFRGSFTYSELVALRQAMEEKVRALVEHPEYTNAAWKAERIGEPYHLVRVFGDGNLYIGAWVRVASLVEPLRSTRTGDETAVLMVNAAGEQLYSTRPLEEAGLDFSRVFGDGYYLSERGHSHLIVGEASGKGDFGLAAAIPDRSILENLPYLKRATAIVIALAVLMLPLGFWFLRQLLLLPLRKMVAAMRLIGQGNFSTRMEERQAPDEFQLVNRTFNLMSSQIEALKINVYEEQISKQRAELKQLQLQINPHFFMNSLNILYNLAQVKQYGLIQEMTMSLVQYFRYMFQSGRSLVLLQDELDHIGNYLRIQRMRFAGQLSCAIQVPDYLGETRIPPLLLQTIVENTIKHAVRADGRTTLTIEAALDDLAEQPMVCLTVRDDGPGYSEAALADFRSGRVPTDGEGDHIGLWNARERLRLQYGDQAWMACYNDDPHGAVTEIAVPLNADGKGRKGDAYALDRR